MSDFKNYQKNYPNVKTNVENMPSMATMPVPAKKKSWWNNTITMTTSPKKAAYGLGATVLTAAGIYGGYKLYKHFSGNKKSEEEKETK